MEIRILNKISEFWRVQIRSKHHVYKRIIYQNVTNTDNLRDKGKCSLCLESRTLKN